MHKSLVALCPKCSLGSSGRDANVDSRGSSPSAWNIHSRRSWGYTSKRSIERLSVVICVLTAYKRLCKWNTRRMNCVSHRRVCLQCGGEWLVWLLISASLLYEEFEVLMGFWKGPRKACGLWKLGTRPRLMHGVFVFEAGSHSPSLTALQLIASVLELRMLMTLPCQRDFQKRCE